MAGDFSDSVLRFHGGFCTCPLCVPKPMTTETTYSWSVGCADCGATWSRHFLGCPSLVAGIELNPKVRLCWLCARCKKMNAPHVDQCPCEPVP